MHLTPSNLLEEKLLACKTDFGQWPTFVAALLNSQVVVLLDGEVGDDGVLTNPLTLATPKGYDVIALFTSVDRATWLVEKFPQFPYALRVDAKWLLARVSPSLGIAINPGWNVGFEMAPEGFARFRNEYL